MTTHNAFDSGSHSGRRILNYEHTAATTQSEFPLFSYLPEELRLEIWQHALRRQRFILLTLRAYRGVYYPAWQFSTGERYVAFADGAQTKSKLLRVNRESRKEALKFYRATFDCQLIRTSGGRQHHEQGTLSINPEWDMLSIDICDAPVRDTLIDFLFRLKTKYDPHGIGLLNLGICLSALNVDDPSSLNLRSDLHPETTVAVVETLMQLREVFFFVIQQDGRLRDAGPRTSHLDELLNQSLPIMTSVPSFERLPHDPRTLDENYSISIDSVQVKAAFFLWHEFLRKFDVSPPFVKYKMLLAFDPHTYGGDPVVDLRSAEAFLEREQTALLHMGYWRGRPLASGPQTVPRLPHPTEPAFGFWLFPMDEFQEYATRYNELEEDQMENRYMWGWSGVNAELAVSYLG